MKRGLSMKYYLSALLLVAIPAFGQEFRGTLSGDITDPGAAAVANAQVTVTETHTGTAIHTTSDAAGQYTAPFLLPGDYEVHVAAAGFKEFTRRGIHVGAGDHPVIDVRLEVGASSQTVEVTADATLLNSENASIGQAITTKEVEEMPLNGRTPMMLAQLALGVVATGQPSLIHPFDSGGASAWSVGGSYAQTSELLVDGSPDATWDGRLAYSPPQDAVQEVRVKAFDSDAAYGHTGGGTLNQVMKTGTNSLHATLWEFNQPSNLTANSFFNNKNNLGNPLTHYNQYGLTAGGPVLVPKVFNGRNKLFWFFAWESLKDSQPNSDTTSVPTDAERQGNFSQILSADGTVLYNPYSAVQSGTTITRTPYAANQIPSSQLSPIAQAYLKFYPQPNLSNARADGALNFGNNSTTNDDFNNELGRIDYNQSDRNRMFFNVRRTGYEQLKNNYFDNAAEGSTLFRNNWGGTFDDVVTISPANVADVRINFTRMAELHGVPSRGFDPSALGFPSYLSASSQYLQMPFIGFSGSCGSQTSFQCLGGSGANNLPSQSVQLFASWIRIQGNHMLKFGVDARQYRLNTFTAGNSAGNFSFTNNSYMKASSSASSTVAWGQDLAAFLLGLPNAGTFDSTAYGSFYSYYTAGFIQDDWRVLRNLTVNLGLRFDHDGPYHEKYGRSVDGFAFDAPNPIAPAAMAAYAKAPVAQLPASAFNVLGGMTFAGPGNTAVYQNTSHLVSPRAGFAWSPGKLNGKTVIRAGFGMFVAPVTISTLAVSGTYSTSPILNQQGFSQTTSMTTPSYLAPVSTNTLSDPFPNGIQRPVGSSRGLATFLGQNVSFLDPGISSPYSFKWNFDIEQTLSPNAMLEVAYIGNHAVHLPVSVTQENGLPRQYLSTLGTRDSGVSYLTGSTPNPFAGLATSNSAATTSVAQLLSRFPEFPAGDGATGYSGSGGVLEQNGPFGSSFFDSLNVRLEKRYSHGLMLVGNYIFSKLTEFDSWLNASDARPEKRISPSDHTHRFIAAVRYELPAGRGKWLNLQSRWLNAVAGGWSINSIYTYQTGAPITWVNGSTSTPGDYIYFGGPIALDNRNANSAAFKTSAFDTKSADQLQYHIRTFATTFGNLRADGINQWDASLLKMFHPAEGIAFQLRFESFNTVNHPTFAAPNTTATNSQFGLITAQADRQRTIQVGARIIF